MTPEQYAVAKRLIQNNKVVLEADHFPLLYFSVHSQDKVYLVRYDVKIYSFSRCTCEHGSVWAVNKPEEQCRHIIAIRLWLQQYMSILVANWNRGKLNASGAIPAKDCSAPFQRQKTSEEKT